VNGPGTLDWTADVVPLVAQPVADALPAWGGEVLAAPIDPALADTAAFCETYGVALEDSANCVVIAGRRGDTVRYAPRRRQRRRAASFGRAQGLVRADGGRGRLEWNGVRRHHADRAA
jgi:hypothetical protein